MAKKGDLSSGEKMPRQSDNIKKIITTKGALREEIKAYWILQELKTCCKSMTFESQNQKYNVTAKIELLSNLIYNDIMVALNIAP